MDIEQLKEQIAADPQAPFDDSALSAEERAALAAFRDEMAALDAKIAKALAVDVPELTMPELPAVGETSDEGSNVVDLPARRPLAARAPLWLGLAASVALVAVFGSRSFLTGIDSEALAAEIVAHIDHEPQALVVTSTPVAEQRLLNVVDSGGAELNSSVGLVTYAQSCIINGKTVPHLVIQGKLGPITLLLMPDEPVDGAVPISGESINGVILPVGGGSIAIIGEREENLSEIEQQVVDSVTWKI